MTTKDAFDLWWEWAEKPLDSPLTIPAEIHEAVMALPPNERHDHPKGQCGRARRASARPALTPWRKRATAYRIVK